VELVVSEINLGNNWGEIVVEVILEINTKQGEDGGRENQGY